MKPVAFAYTRPPDIEGAVRALTEAEGFAKLLAGGQSLGPMLNLRLVQPDLVVDIRRLESLRAVEETTDELTIGAAVTHSEIEDSKLSDVTGGLMAHVAGTIAYRAVRNRGTIGGSLAHADPAADWPAAMRALGANVTIHGPDGRRRIDIDAFLPGTFETALGDHDILEAIHVPNLAETAHWGAYKFCRKAGEFAEVLATIVQTPHGVRAALGGKDVAALTIADASEALRGPDAIANLIDRHAAASDDDQKHLYNIALARAVAHIS